MFKDMLEALKKQGADAARSVAGSGDFGGQPVYKDVRVKERRGRPSVDQGWTQDGRKDMRGRPKNGATLYKVGTEPIDK